MPTERYICVHGHFYQPPRENPWLDRIDIQESASPFHDWNERIDRECYVPNAAARILDDHNRIARIVSNYDAISFNFGPTLCSWLEAHDPQVYQAILDSDRRSAERYGGHGSAIAQAWGHAILPLCNERDKRTQVSWGVQDFKRRFGRQPEGMWLPETAVDTATLEVLADCGIRFTILAPSQAIAVRPTDSGTKSQEWTDVASGGIDTRQAYRCKLPSGRQIALFFYDGGVSQAVAFERLLARGDRFAARLLEAFSTDADGPQLVHIATDGETYGHHHKFGDMALAWAIDALDKRSDVRLTNYGEFLERHPPSREVRIRERSAWSCAHGVGRWSADCGCCIGTNPDWNQAWRAPLRAALDLLRDDAAVRFEQDTAGWIADPWAARDGYIDVMVDDSPAGRQRYLAENVASDLDPAGRRRAWKLLELQRQAVLMYTSCGWFFDDLAGIETVQVLRYAARALEIHEDLYPKPDGSGLRNRFLDALATAKSNQPLAGDGRSVFETSAANAAASLPRIAASLAVRLLFDGDTGDAGLPALDVTIDRVLLQSAGPRRLAVARIRLTRRATDDSADLAVAALYSGDHDLLVGVQPFGDLARQAELTEALRAAFDADNGGAGCAGLLRERFPQGTRSLGGLLADERQFALGRILETTLDELEAVFRKLLDNHAPLRRSVAGLGSTLPLEMRLPAELVLNKDVRRALDEHDADRLNRLVARANEEGLSLDGRSLGLAAGDALSLALGDLAEAPPDADRLERVAALAHSIVELPFGVDLQASQNTVWNLRRRSGDAAPPRFAAALDRLAETLGLGQRDPR